jgi:hypothetical protein
VLAAAVSTGVAAASAETPAAGAPTFGERDRVPQLAYYYIWFDPASWDRAKTDLPQLGKYSSDDPHVIRQHIRWAKQAGLDGFIVSWKHTEVLSRRLELLVDIAESEDFSLAIIYQGLDFHREPQPVERVASDLALFETYFAPRRPFRLFEKPLVIWSGTWKFTRDDIARAAGPVRRTLTVLASEKNVEGYERLADVVDGNAYYWSSVNPDTYPDYIGKLTDLSHAVHRHDGLWIAPAAPGFDARKLGGTTVVGRKDGSMLTRQLAAANASAPDALGIISWNEFSENSHVEPSQRYGLRYLDVLSAYLGDGAAISPVRPLSSDVADDSTDSSAPGEAGAPMGLIVVPLTIGLSLAAMVVIVRRNGPRIAVASGRIERRIRREWRRRRTQPRPW